MEKLKFMDFCAGIGGGRVGLTNNNLECVGYSEIDLLAEKTYKTLYGDKEKNYGDLTKIDADKLPNFDLLIGGFPCQTFSVMGKRAGFDDSRGMIIYSLIKIMREKNIPYFILENVKGLVNHNKGETLREIVKCLEDAGYNVEYKVLNSLDYGVPQMRERIYFIGIRKDIKRNKFVWPKPFKNQGIENFLIDKDAEEQNLNDKIFQKYLNNKYNMGRFNLDDILKKDYLVLDTRQSDLRLYDKKVPTLRTGRHGILYVKNNKLYKLSGYESLLLQGFPKPLADKVKENKLNNSKILSQAGNAMTVSVIDVLCSSLIKCIGGSNEK